MLICIPALRSRCKAAWGCLDAVFRLHLLLAVPSAPLLLALLSSCLVVPGNANLMRCVAQLEAGLAATSQMPFAGLAERPHWLALPTVALSEYNLSRQLVYAAGVAVGKDSRVAASID